MKRTSESLDFDLIDELVSTCFCGISRLPFPSLKTIHSYPYAGSDKWVSGKPLYLMKMDVLIKKPA